MHLISTIFFISLLASLFHPASAAVSIGDSHLAKEIDNANATDYWTPERMKTAKQMPLPAVSQKVIKEVPLNELQQAGEKEAGDGSPPEHKEKPNFHQLFDSEASTDLNVNKDFTDIKPTDRGTLKEQFSSSRLIPLSADLNYPYTTVGKLFFTIPGKGDYVCSAAVIRPRVLLTAGHCLHSGSQGAAGFYTNWLFVPAYRDGKAPFQSWNWKYAIVTSTWASGGGKVPNAADYGMLEVEDRSFNNALFRIGAITGYLGYQTLSLSPNHAHLLGYPCNLDSCQKMHQVTAQSARVVSPNNAEYGSDMSGGSSGGPWVQNFGAYANGQLGGLNSGINRVVGVTSYGYISKDPKGQGSSIPDSRFISILNTVCAHRPGNCA